MKPLQTVLLVSLLAAPLWGVDCGAAVGPGKRDDYLSADRGGGRV